MVDIFGHNEKTGFCFGSGVLRQLLYRASQTGTTRIADRREVGGKFPDIVRGIGFTDTVFTPANTAVCTNRDPAVILIDRIFCGTNQFIKLFSSFLLAFFFLKNFR
jgi:hypothetical protein